MKPTMMTRCVAMTVHVCSQKLALVFAIPTEVFGLGVTLSGAQGLYWLCALWSLAAEFVLSSLSSLYDPLQ